MDFPAPVVSGNDLLAVVALAERLSERMRGGGPELVECKTYRYRGHSEHDPALYRDKNELIEWEARDAIPQYEFFLEKKGHDWKRIREEVDERAKQVVQAAVEFADQYPMPGPKEAMEDIYARAPIPSSASATGGYHPPVYQPREGDVVEPFTRRRKLIAEHMVYSKTHPPHVGTLAEVDLTKLTRGSQETPGGGRRRGCDRDSHYDVPRALV